MKILINNDSRPLSLLDKVKLRGALVSSLSEFRDRIPSVEIQIGFVEDSAASRSPGCRIVALLKNTSIAMVSTSDGDDFDSALGAIQRLRTRIDRLIQDQTATQQINPFKFGFSA